MEAKTIREFSNVIFRNSELQLLLRDYKSPQMKIEEMEKKSELIQLKRGMYIVNSTDYGIPLSVPLCSNHIYGPSYVSLHWALHYYGLIPEMVYTMTAVTTKRSRKFENQLGRFTYYQVPDDYFSIGIRMVEENGVHFLMASPEKALCDMIM